MVSYATRLALPGQAHATNRTTPRTSGDEPTHEHEPLRWLYPRALSGDWTPDPLLTILMTYKSFRLPMRINNLRIAGTLTFMNV